MGVITNLLSFRFWGSNATADQTGVQIPEPIIRTTSTKNRVPDLGQDGALQDSVVWAAIELLADTIGTLPKFVYKRASGPEGHKEQVRDIQLAKLMSESPNRRHTPAEFWTQMAMSFVMRGNAYARKVLNDKGEVIELWPLAPDQMEVEVLRDRSLAYKYYVDQKVIVYSEDSIFHWRDKGNGVVGLDRLSFMRNALAVSQGTTDRTLSIHKRGAKRPGVFMIDKLLTSKQREQIRANYSGLVEDGEDDLLILEMDAKFQSLDLTPADMQMDAQRRFSVEEIARFFGIPGILLNDSTKSTSWGSGIHQIVEGFHKFRLRPILVGLDQAIRARVMTSAQRARYVVETSADALLAASLKERVEIYERQVRNGLKTRDEVRQLENDPPLPGGEKLTVEANMVYLENLGDNIGVNPQETPPGE